MAERCHISTSQRPEHGCTAGLHVRNLIICSFLCSLVAFRHAAPIRVAGTAAREESLSAGMQPPTVKMLGGVVAFACSEDQIREKCFQTQKKMSKTFVTKAEHFQKADVFIEMHMAACL